MIIDHLKNASLYYGAHEKVAAGLRWLQSQDLVKLAPGRYELDGTNLFVIITEYETKTKDKVKWEAHKNYFDIQCIISGKELIGYAHIGDCQLGAYDESKDFQEILAVEGAFPELGPGMFMVLAPQDVHAPGIAPGAAQPAKKAIVKVHV
jgi:YhcH/YjgK/YiaL family protein